MGKISALRDTAQQFTVRRNQMQPFDTAPNKLRLNFRHLYRQQASRGGDHSGALNRWDLFDPIAHALKIQLKSADRKQVAKLCTNFLSQQRRSAFNGQGLQLMHWLVLHRDLSLLQQTAQIVAIFGLRQEHPTQPNYCNSRQAHPHQSSKQGRKPKPLHPVTE